MSDIIPFNKKIHPKDLVLRFMDSMGHKRDAETYLKIFSSKKPESFAIVVIDATLLSEEIDAIIFDLRYLMRLELYPIIVTHATEEQLQKSDTESYFKKAKLTKSFQKINMTEIDKLDYVKLCVKNKTLPIFYLEKQDDFENQLSRLIQILQTGKVIFLRQMGSILNQKTQNQISIVNLRFDKNSLVEKNLLSTDDKNFLTLCEELILKSDHKLFVSLVSPLNLIRELFTVKGAGTLVQLGSKISCYTSWKEVNQKLLKELLQMSFRQSVKDDFFKKRFDYFYIEENYSGAALLKKYKDMFYLSKFAVGTEARGLGIGRDLWSEITHNHSKIFWRSSPNNFITNWYQKQCDGMHKTKDWYIFWKGIKKDEITDAIEYASKKDVDFSRKLQLM